MCMQGMVPSGKALVVICLGAVVFSPLIVVGALGYGAVRGVSAGAQAVKNSSSGKALKNRIGQFKKRLMKKLGRDVIDREIKTLTAEIQKPNPDANLFMRRATLYYLSLDYANSILDLDAFLDHNPSNVTANMMKGQMLSYLEEFERANDAFSRALEDADAEREYKAYSDVGQLPTNIVKGDVEFEIASNKIRQALVSDGWKTDAGIKTVLSDAIAHARAHLESVTPRDESGNSYDEETFKAEFLLGLGLFSLWCQDEKDPELINEAKQLLSFQQSGEGRSLYGQVCKLAGDDDAASNAVAYAQTTDPNVFVVDHNDHDQLTAPWPVTRIRADGSVVHDHHAWNLKTFHRPTFCEHCGKYVHVKMFKVQNYECARCMIRVHADCKDLCKSSCIQAAQK